MLLFGSLRFGVKIGGVVSTKKWKLVGFFWHDRKRINFIMNIQVLNNVILTSSSFSLKG